MEIFNLYLCTKITLLTISAVFWELSHVGESTAVEVAKEVLDIFCIFGAPSIIQSDNGREFSNSIIEELSLMWKG